MNADQLAAWLQEHLPRHMASVRLDSRHFRVNYVLNWGGFVNHSFTVSDSSNRYHLKITNKETHIPRLRRWTELHEVLERRYRAPRLINWIELPEIGFAGLLFEHVEGRAADFSRSPHLLPEIVGVANSLHKDEAVRSYLESTAGAKSYFDYFVETYIDRFTADLEIVATDQPSFMGQELFRWMEDETRRLQDSAYRTESFHQSASAPVHGDLHGGNVIVTSSGPFIVDWDDLSLGDPAVEFAVLVWPVVYQGKTWQDALVHTADSTFGERMDICLRAQLLDEVIDNLADYVEAPSVVPHQRIEVQRAKKARHEEALKRYRARY